MTTIRQKEFIEAVNTLARNKSEFPFESSSPDLAAIVMAAILEFSEREVRIYERSINGDIADQHPSFLHAAEHFLLVGNKLKIVVREHTANESKTYEELMRLCNEYPKQLKIKLADEDFRKNIKDVLNMDINFMVGDRKSYRMETTESADHRKAICCFNDKEMAGKLVSAFDKHFSLCKDVKIPSLTC